MSIKRVKEEPTSGQWVEVWECAGFIWSATYDRSEEPKTQYNPFTGDYVEPDIKSPSCKNIQYFVYERDEEKPDIESENTVETASGGFASARLVPGDDGVVLILFQPGQHRSIMPLSRSGAEAIVKVLSKALELEVKND